MTSVHQFVPTLIRGDAVGHHVLELRALLRGMGVDSEIFATEIDPALADSARPYGEFTGDDAGATLVYHASTASPLAEFLAGRPEPKIVDYHNVTPPEFFTGWDPPQATRLRAARHEIAGMVRDAASVITHSRYSARDVDAWGHRDAAVLPVLGSSFLESPEAAPPEVATDPHGPTWLFVGRCAPNKAQHELIKALVIHRRSYGGRARLRLVGAASPAAYRDALVGLAAAAGVADAVEVHESVPATTLAEWYRDADVFVSASAHEGYCVPVLEAMRFGLPVVARAAGAVPETAGGAAVLVAGASASALAVAVERVRSDPALGDALVAAGHSRVATVVGGAHDAYRATLAAYLGRAS